ncbi:GNAT family N-acetyltransferase [Halobacteria archaeon HArc-gm2]|nr:GNAT family N-acetyltransferase [Halobacteria archaeon HArc-gm2]
MREFRSEDRDGVLALDRTVWGRDRGEDWFDWKYASNPIVGHVPMFVTEYDGEIVGARPFMAFRIRAGESVVDALQPSDTMVHPDHRRRGLFSRMTRRAIATYADEDPALLFNFPNDAARPGYEKLGWRTLGPQVTYYRVQDPARLFAERFDGPARELARRTLRPLVRSVRRTGTHASGRSDVDVQSRRGVPCATLASLYDRRVPGRFHVLRDEELLRWRFGSPAWSRTTYLASRGGTVVAALVARTRTLADGATVTQVADVLPLPGDASLMGTATSLFGAVTRDHADSTLVAVSAGATSPAILHRLGFRPDDRPPLSWLRSRRKSLAVRPLPLSDSSWTLDGRPVDVPTNWTGTFVERDTT